MKRTLVFLAQRLVLLIVAVLALSLVIFAAVRVLPGDVAQIMAGMNAPESRVETLREQLGLSRPWWVQYGNWLSGILHGDLGTSLTSGVPIASQMADRASITLPLVCYSLLIALVLGISFGVISVIARASWLRSTLHLLCLTLAAVPAIWAGLLIILLFGKGVGLVGIFPAQGIPEARWAASASMFASLTLPALSVGIIVAATIMRHTRAQLLSVQDHPAVIFAMANGATYAQSMVRVGLRLVLAQLVSVAGLAFAEMITGVMVIERLFTLPGLGSGLMIDMSQRDLLAVPSQILLLAVVIITIGVCVDIAHHLLDPRVNYMDKEQA